MGTAARQGAGAGRIFQACESFNCTLGDGTQVAVVAGRTRVREGHELMAGDRAQFFEPLTVDFDIEQATAAPGEKRGQGRTR